MDKDQNKDKKKLLGNLAECLEGSLADSLQERPDGSLKVEPWELIFPTFSLSIDDAQWLAAGIREYLNGKNKSLDKALGLTNRLGRRPDPTKEELIVQVFLENSGKLTNLALADAVEKKHGNIFPVGSVEPKQIRRAKKSNSMTEALSVELTRQMDENKGGQN